MPKVETVRFSLLVEEAGPPDTATLWTEPADDKGFMKAVREGRVVTLRQQNVGSKKDVGLVGYSKTRHGTYLVFPKPLRRPEGTRVIGIKYNLIQEPQLVPRPTSAKVKPKRSRDTSPAASSAETTRPTKSPPTPAKWQVSLRVQASLTMSIEVEARNKATARAGAARQLADQPIDWSKAHISRKITAVKRRQLQD